MQLENLDEIMAQLNATTAQMQNMQVRKDTLDKEVASMKERLQYLNDESTSVKNSHAQDYEKFQAKKKDLDQLTEDKKRTKDAMTLQNEAAKLTEEFVTLPTSDSA